MSKTMSKYRSKLFALVILIMVVVPLLITLTGCSNSNDGSVTFDAANNTAEATASNTDAEYAEGFHYVEVTVEGYDTFTIVVDANTAPITATNFLELVNDGYYDGLAFYRIVDGFCLQGGTLGNTASSVDTSLDTIVGEFSDNGYDNALADNFERGVVAMARTTDPDSATSTFFITLSDNDTVGTSLDGLYAAFGTIDDAGMTIVDQIVADYLDAVDNETLGTISDEDAMPIILSVVEVEVDADTVNDDTEIASEDNN